MNERLFQLSGINPQHSNTHSRKHTLKTWSCFRKHLF